MTTTRGWTQGAEADRLEALLALHEVALDTMAHGLCMFDADHRVVLFNRRYIEMFNLSPEVVRPGVAFRDVLAHSAERGNFSPAALDAEWRKRWDRLVLGRPFSMHQPMPGGGTIAMHFRPMPGGGWVTIFEDVTAQQRMQDELRIQVERLKQAVGHMSHGLCLFDADERLIVCNEQYLRMYSLDPAVVKPGITFRDALAHAVSIRNVHMTADEFYARRIAMVRRRETVTEQLRLSDGRVIETTVRPIEDGGWVADHEDITVRLRAEEKLREQNMLFDAGLENMAHGLCTYDRDLRVIVRNSRYLEMYRLDPDDAQPGTPLVELMRTSIARGVHEPGSTAERRTAAGSAPTRTSPSASAPRRRSASRTCASTPRSTTCRRACACTMRTIG